MEEEKKFPCACGKSHDTAKEFSDHVHDDRLKCYVGWGPLSGEKRTKP